LTHQILEASFESPPLIEDGNDDSNAVGPNCLSGFDPDAACASEETQPDAKGEDELQTG
jgi:hypothetical protein